MTSTGVPRDRSSDEIDAWVRGHLADNAALYELDLAALEAAAPDFVVSQALCDVCAVSLDEVQAMNIATPYAIENAFIGPDDFVGFGYESVKD